MDWEMKAKGLAEDLQAVGFGLLSACAWLAFEVDGWWKALPVLGIVAAINAIAGGKIKT
jgi:hypothetical protein